MKTNLKKFAITFLTILSIGITTQAVSVKADTYSNFTVTPIYPENQISDKSYYDLLMEPNQKQTIYFNVKNYGSQTGTFVFEVKNGSTSTNAEKQYLNDKDVDKSMRHPMDSLIDIPNNRIELLPGESRDIAVNLSMPDEDLDGVIVGAIRAYSETEADYSKDKETQNMAISNRLNYLMIIQLRMNENEVQKNLNLMSYGGKVSDLSSSFYANIQNDQAVVMNDLDVKGAIYRKSDRKLVSEIDLNNRGILPNTNFDVVFTPESNKLVAGTYELELKINDEENVWEWKEEFEITKKEANKIYSESLNQKRDYTLHFIVIVLILIILILIFLLLYLNRSRREEK